MSKKMWHKIFKSKSQKPQPLAKINKRHSRGIYEEYQQLGDLLAGEKAQLNFNQNEKENDHGNGCGNASGNANANGNGNVNGNGNINVFEQQPQQSSFNSLELSEAHQQSQQQHQLQLQQQQRSQPQLSTFSRVRNTFSLRRGKKQLPANVKSTTITTTDLDADDTMRGADEDPQPHPPPPLTSGQSLPVPEIVPVQSSDLTPCPCCSRTFNLNALRKHVVICEKTSKKRKAFDSSRQRREGTSLSTYVLPKNFGLPNAERTAGLSSPPTTSREAAAAAAPSAEAVSSPLPVRRKSQTEMVRSTARASMRKAGSTLSNSSGGEAHPVAASSSAPALAAAGPAPRERSLAKRIKAPACDKCPHCDRTFNPKAFDRHVEWCKEKALQANMKSGNTQETSKAKERLEARKQYKPPNLKTKRSVARDKYSGNHEELLDAGDMPSPKPNMMSLSMTSSVHSDNNQVAKARNPVARSTTQVTQNQVRMYMSQDEDPPSSPPPPPRERVSQRSKRKPADTCSEIDASMELLRRQAGGDPLQLATLDCVEAPVLQPTRRRKSVPKLEKPNAGAKEVSLPNLPQVTMTFEELNGLIKRKGGTPLSNMQMAIDEQELASLTAKKRSSTSLVRQARRRIRTRENPCLQLDSAPLQQIRRAVCSGSEDESPRPEIQIKMEATTMRTMVRPKKRSGSQSVMNLTNLEPMKALPMPQLKQSLEAINQSMEKSSLPRLKIGIERPEQNFKKYEDGPDEEISDLDYDDEEEEEKEAPNDNRNEDEEKGKPVMKLPPLVKQGSNVSRRLVLLEQDENGTMYIKSAPKRRLKRSDSNMSVLTDASSQQEEKQNRLAEMEKKAAPDDQQQQKREIFISIETEVNDQGRSPISPDSLRHMVGNPHTPIDVLHIENGNEPEHARFRKISDTEDAGEEPADRSSQFGGNSSANRLAPSASATSLAPNVQLNNAKNLIQRMHSDFRKMGEEASASMLRTLIGQSGRSEEQSQPRDIRDPDTLAQMQHQQQQQPLQQHQQAKVLAPLTPSPSADSDELSSLDGYPMSSSQSSRRGASSKLSSDSAYGSSNSPYSLSRQRSSEMQMGSTPRSQGLGLLRPHTASAKLPGGMADASTQAQTQYGTLKARQRLFGGGGGGGGGGINNNGNCDGEESSSSGSENSLAVQQNQQQQQQQAINYNYQQQHQAQSQPDYNTNSNNNNITAPGTPTTSEHSLLSSMSNSSMSSSMKMSKFCHECGAKFIIEHAKFCMDCGVRRMVL